MNSTLKNVRSRVKATATISQSQPIPGQEEFMAKNPSGGYSFVADEFTALNRFLLLGTEGGSFHTSEKKLTLDNVKSAQAALALDGHRVVDMIVDVSDRGRALKQDPALFVLALASAVGGKTPTEAQIKVRQHALRVLPRVARTSTALFHFAEFYQNQRGWGRSGKQAIARWYEDKPLDKLAVQAWKYKSRDGWSHGDILSLSHAKADTEARNQIFKYMKRPDESVLKTGLGNAFQLDGSVDDRAALAQIAAAEELLRTTDVARAVKLITDYNLTREAVNTSLLNDKTIWEALLQDMPATALLRNLNKMTIVGLFTPMSNSLRLAQDKLNDMESLRRQRVHPMQVLIAMKQYASGRGQDHGGGRTPLSWSPVAKIVDALDESFYGTFALVEPTGKRILVGIDTSGSMSGGSLMGISGFSPLMASAAFALVTARTEPNTHIMGFDTRAHEMAISPKQRLDDVLKDMARHRGGGTDTSLPFQYLLDKKIEADAVVTFTDNCTWAGYQHPVQAMAKVRAKYGNVRAINCATDANSSSQLPGSDPYLMEAVGFDASLTTLISEFVAGNI